MYFMLFLDMTLEQLYGKIIYYQTDKKRNIAIKRKENEYDQWKINGHDTWFFME